MVNISNENLIKRIPEIITKQDEHSIAIERILAKQDEHSIAIERILAKQDEHSATIAQILNRLEEHSKIFVTVINRLTILERRMDVLDERTAYLPKLYEHVDAFMQEIKESRMERVVMSAKISDHEERIVALEVKA